MITKSQGGGYAQMITILHGGGLSGPPKVITYYMHDPVHMWHNVQIFGIAFARRAHCSALLAII